VTNAARRTTPCAWRLLALAAAWPLAATLGGPADAPRGAVHSLPAASRSYEVLVPPLPAKDLVNLAMAVYLHPSTQPSLARAKADYWPVLRDRKCLMVLPKSRGKKMWLAGEDKMVTDVIADVQTRYSVDAKRIVLMGAAGGGQVALRLADQLPGKFRAAIVISTSPGVVRGSRYEWFYPNRKVLKTCPYFVINHITQGSALMYWRQVQAKLAPAGASISILPVTGKPDEYLPPPKPLGAWLGQVLSGKHPTALPDPQAAAVAKMLRPCADAWAKAFPTTRPAPRGKAITKDGKVLRLTVAAPADFERSEREHARDAGGGPLTQIRLEHKTWPITIRFDARATAAPMAATLAAEEKATRLRGLLYQVYRRQDLTAGGRKWAVKVGSITYPDRRRGWVSAWFVHAAAPIKADPKRWLTVLVADETQQPEAAELAGIVKAALAHVAAAPAPPPPATAPGRK